MQLSHPPFRSRSLKPAGFSSLLLLLALCRPSAVFACAACFGQSDSPMASGMNWGIFSLLGMILLVLGGVAGFFVFLARRAAALAASSPAAASPVLPAGPTAPEPQPS